MAAVFPLDTSKPWVFNGVTYEFDASEDRWYVVSSAVSEEVVDELSQLENRVESTENKTHENTDRIEDLENAPAPDGVSQEYVDDGLALKVDKSDYDSDYQAVLDGSAVPVGSIMIWLNSTPPSGWFKLQGGSFDINTYPQLHAYLSNTSNYTSGTLPAWTVIVHYIIKHD